METEYIIFEKIFIFTSCKRDGKIYAAYKYLGITL